MKYRKQYINVDVVFDTSGRMRPQVIHWVDGRRYEISRVKAIVPAAARKSGGQGDRYTVMLAGQERYLFFERPTGIVRKNCRLVLMKPTHAAWISSAGCAILSK